MDSGDWPAIISAVGLVIGSVFAGIAGLERRRGRVSSEDAAELEQYRVWRPRVRRAVVIVEDVFAAARIPMPDGVAELFHFPPPSKARHARDEVESDAE